MCFCFVDGVCASRLLKIWLSQFILGNILIPVVVAAVEVTLPCTTPLAGLSDTLNCTEENGLVVLSVYSILLRTTSVLLTFCDLVTLVGQGTMLLIFGVLLKLLSFHSYIKELRHNLEPLSIGNQTRIYRLLKHKLKMYTELQLLVCLFNESYQFILFLYPVSF